MRKIILITFALLASVQFAFAQQAIAKIKYEEAEEAYSINDFETTLTKLNEVEALLESTNPKVMYLKIMTQFKIIERNSLNEYKVIEDARQLCTKYLNDYENVPNNDDKYRDIYKISESLKKYSKSEEEFATKIALLDYLHKQAHKFMYGTDGQTIDYTEALKYYTQASEQGDIPSKAEIGRIYLKGLGVQKDYKKAFIHLKEAADKGNSIGQNELGALYFNGWGIEIDYTEALKYYIQAAEQGDVPSKAEIGRIYLKGLGVQKDYKKAFIYLKEAADKGNPVGQNELGLFYLNGWSVEQNFIKAAQLFELASNQGNVMALYNLSRCYYNGNGVNEDCKQSLKYLQLAADKGCSFAQNDLGYKYAYGGTGVKIDINLALKYFQMSADQNDSDGQLYLGVLYSKIYRGLIYSNGYGTIKKSDEAKIWLQKAAAQGNQEAINILK